MDVYKQKIDNFNILREMERSRESIPSPMDALKPSLPAKKVHM